jgi:hypothetical protein
MANGNLGTSGRDPASYRQNIPIPMDKSVFLFAGKNITLP